MPAWASPFTSVPKTFGWIHWDNASYPPERSSGLASPPHRPNASCLHPHPPHLSSSPEKGQPHLGGGEGERRGAQAARPRCPPTADTWCSPAPVVRSLLLLLPPFPPSSRRRNRTTAAGARGRAYIAAGAQPPSSARLASPQRPLLDRPASRTTKEGPGREKRRCHDS